MCTRVGNQKRAGSPGAGVTSWEPNSGSLGAEVNDFNH